MLSSHSEPEATTRYPFLRRPVHAACGIPEAHPPAIPASQVLRLIYSPGTSPPDFSIASSKMTKRNGIRSTFGDWRLTRLVDFLDEARALHSDFRPVMEQILQKPLYDSCYKRYFLTMSIQTTSHLRQVHDPTIPHTTHPAISPKSVITRSLMVALPLYGKAFTAARKCVSSA